MARKNAGTPAPDVAFEGPDHAPRTEIADTGDMSTRTRTTPNRPRSPIRADPSFVDPAEVE